MAALRREHPASQRIVSLQVPTAAVIGLPATSGSSQSQS